MCGGSVGGRMSGGCSDDINEADSMVANDGGTMHNSLLLLSRNKIWDTIFMKLRYSHLTSELGFKNSWKELKSEHWSR